MKKSSLAEQEHVYDHGIAWEDSKLLYIESRWAQRKWKEASQLIGQSEYGISNRDSGRVVTDVYKPILKKQL